MLIVRFHVPFRERAPEWVLSALQVAVGLSLFGASLSPWAALAALSGAMRLVALYINGKWRRSPILRQIGACSGLALWMVMLRDQEPATKFVFLALFAIDAMSLSFASGDAVIAQRRHNDASGS